MAGKRPTPIVRDTDALLKRGIEAVEFDRIEEAVGLLRQAAELEPVSHDIQLVLGIALMRALEMYPAVGAFEAAIAADPRSFFAHFRIAECYMRMGVPSRANEYLDRALEVSGSREQRDLVRQLRSLEAKVAPKRIWRPDFARMIRRRKPE